MIKRPIRGARTIYISAGAMLLLFGYCLYLVYRQSPGIVLQTWPVSQFLMQIVPHSPAHASWMDWLPSFIHVLAFSLISTGLFQGRARYSYAVPVFWMIVVSVFEAGQYFHIRVAAIVPSSWADASPVRHIDNYFRLGTYDSVDIAAAFGGMLAAVLASAPMRGEIPSAVMEWKPILRYLRISAAFLLFSLGIASLLATSTVDGKCDYEPVYLSYSDLRKPVTAVEPHALSQSGKIYVYGNIILFNERNQGIHVIDNTDPAAPVNLRFVQIPGNIDIAVKDNILYADSYIDLVAIDISDLNNIHEVKRVQDVFPYDPYQTVTDRLYRACGYDKSKGIVIGYARRSEK